MAKLSQGILSVVVVSLGASLMFGAVQFASGRDLKGLPQDPRLTTPIADQTTGGSTVNRTTKADRGSVVAESAPTRTISLRLNGSPDMSVVVRIPVFKEARNVPAPLLMNSTERKVACEPVVSVLTEVAKRLQPGRCLT